MTFRPLVRIAAPLVAVLLAACGSGGVTGASAVQNQPFAQQGTLILRVAIASSYGTPVALISVTTRPQNGGLTQTTVTGCAAAGCTVRAASALNFVNVTVQPMAADGTVLDTGQLLANVPVTGRKTMDVAFGTTPAVYHFSFAPASLTLGAPGTAKLSLLARDANQAEIIGTMQLPVPIAITGATSSVTLATAQFTAIGQTIAVAYDGTGTTRVHFSGTAAGSTVDGSTLFLGQAPHVTANGEASGDTQTPTTQRILALPTAPPVPPPLGGLTTSAVRRRLADLGSAFPPIGDQGASTSCTTWSSSYAIRSYFAGIRTGASFTGAGPGGINTSTVFSPAFAFNALDNGANTPLDPLDVVNFLTQYGAISWSEMPFSATAFGPPPTAAQLADGAANPIYDLGTIASGDLASMRLYLDAGYPIWWVADIDDNFEVLGPFQTWNGGGNAAGAHAVVITAYDDTNARFTVRNSWGITWGLRGTGYVTYAQWQAASILNLVLTDQPPS
ncbi:MAG TPA: hypothetical protein VGP41_10935 [Candidatus Lustribacter sp.]|jgi:hypothetical protein|nr:hypothetical protein [Candidatus Lustribacter sp.]